MGEGRFKTTIQVQEFEVLHTFRKPPYNAVGSNIPRIILSRPRPVRSEHKTEVNLGPVAQKLRSNLSQKINPKSGNA